MGIISIADSNDSNHFLLLSSWPLERRYQIWFYSIPSIILKALATPLCNLYLGWMELEISLMFCTASAVVSLSGVPPPSDRNLWFTLTPIVIFAQILVTYLIVNLANKRFTDRQLVVFGLICELIASSWLFWILRLQQHPG